MCELQINKKAAYWSIYVLMINELKSSQRYSKNYAKLPVLLFTFLIFNDSFSE